VEDDVAFSGGLWVCYVTPLVEVSGVSQLELELWSNVVRLPRRQKRSLSGTFLFSMGFLSGVVLACPVARLLFG